jgi:hypothetical protein
MTHYVNQETANGMQPQKWATKIRQASSTTATQIKCWQGKDQSCNEGQVPMRQELPLRCKLWQQLLKGKPVKWCFKHTHTNTQILYYTTISLSL